LPEVICDTSPLQYLHQLSLLRLLPALTEHVLIPPAVEEELLAGKALGVDLPDLTELGWIKIRNPARRPTLPLAQDLGPGETEVLMLGLESPGSVLVLDDGLARRVAETLQLRLTGTLGILLDAKQAGHIPAVRPLLDQLQELHFRLAPDTRAAVLRLAAED
jgi:predicted nucleic acid-binding protein